MMLHRMMDEEEDRGDGIDGIRCFYLSVLRFLRRCGSVEFGVCEKCYFHVRSFNTLNTYTYIHREALQGSK